MARLHSRKKGKSGSVKPSLRASSHSWVKHSKEEVLSMVEKQAKEGKTEAVIGQVLRDQYGIPSVKAITGSSISQILKEKKLSSPYPTDLLDLIKKAVYLRKHLKQHTRDTANKIKLVHIESKIKRLVRYYRGKKLPVKWKYNPDEAALLVK